MVGIGVPSRALGVDNGVGIALEQIPAQHQHNLRASDAAWIGVLAELCRRSPLVLRLDIF